MCSKSFIEKSILLNGSKYDYSISNYINSSTKVDIMCLICNNKFSQTPNNHISKKQGCPYCNGNKKKTTLSFIEHAKSIHLDKYDYSLVEYKNNLTEVRIKCNTCLDDFNQTPKIHLRSGCPNCTKNKRYTIESLHSKLNLIHNESYVYDLTTLKDVKSKIRIYCKEHGEFWQRCSHHLNGSICPSCNMSIGEKRINDILNKLNINFIFQKSFTNCKGIKRLLPFDFYLIDMNICIEYDGIQHFEPIDYFGGIDVFQKRKLNDLVKSEFCVSNGIKLVRIPYYDFDNIESILLSNLFA